MPLKCRPVLCHSTKSYKPASVNCKRRYARMEGWFGFNDGQFVRVHGFAVFKVRTACA